MKSLWLIGALATAAAAAGGADAPCPAGATGTLIVCRHDPSGRSGGFDVARARRAMEEDGAEPAGESKAPRRPPDVRSEQRPPLRAGVGGSRTVKLDAPLPASWVGRDVVVAPAARIAEARELAADAIVVISGWRSSKELASAAAAGAGRTVIVGSAGLAQRLGVWRDETRVRVDSTSEVSLSPF